MAKIHTHYDNLKVARLAPPEVIRAAYKALSQKYHPDKNAGDDKAARIMAIVNSAYGILSDPVRRKEHDEWISAEEWEIDWLESTRGEDVRGDRQRGEYVHPDGPEHIDLAHPYRVTRDPKWWLGLGVCFAVGCIFGVLIGGQPKVLPVALASPLAAKADRRAAVVAEAEPHVDALLDSWAVGKPSAADAAEGTPDIKALAITQLVIPARPPDCDTELHTLVAPNGEPWPGHSGYVEGYPVGNKGDEMQLLVDNSANGSPVFVKIYDLDRRSNVRHLFLLPRDTMSIDKLAVGKYEVRYQNIEVGGNKAECAGRKRRVVKQAAASPGTQRQP